MDMNELIAELEYCADTTNAQYRLGIGPKIALALLAERAELKKDAELTRAKLEAAYMAGWEASGEGWNDEYPGDAHLKESFIEGRRTAIDAAMEQSK